MKGALVARITLASVALMSTQLSIASAQVGRGDASVLTSSADFSLNTGTGLTAVSVLSDTSAWAVGTRVRSSGAIKTYATHWNGTSWTEAPTPDQKVHDNILTAVSVRSASDAWAVGYFGSSSSTRTLILHWNGTSWLRVASPNPGAFYRYLNAVDVASKNDVWAVGQFYTATGGWQTHTMTLHWNGSKWSSVQSPNPSATSFNTLTGVSGLASGDVWAVGGDGENNFSDGPGEPLILHWNGTKWMKTQPLAASQISLYSVSEVSASDVWAVGNVGYGYNPDVYLHWDGGVWTEASAPSAGFQHNRLSSVSAVSSTDVWAVGMADEQTATFHWDGLSWTRVVSPDPSNYSVLNSVSAGSTSNVMAVGYWIDANTSAQSPLMPKWDGFNWAI